MTEQEKKELLDELEKRMDEIQRLSYQRRCCNHIKSAERKVV